jgi:hypothetical protein
VFPRLDITQKAAKPERLFFCFERDLFTLPKCKDDARILLHNQFFDLLLFRVDSGKIFRSNALSIIIRALQMMRSDDFHRPRARATRSHAELS